jgi:hypothetical protein
MPHPSNRCDSWLEHFRRWGTSSGEVLGLSSAIGLEDGGTTSYACACECMLLMLWFHLLPPSFVPSLTASGGSCHAVNPTGLDRVGPTPVYPFIRLFVISFNWSVLFVKDVL